MSAHYILLLAILVLCSRSDDSPFFVAMVVEWPSREESTPTSLMEATERRPLMG